MDESLVKWSQEVLERDKKVPPKQRFDRLIASGVIDEHGKVRLWHAFLAVIAVKRNGDGKRIEAFRCLKSVYGMPGFTEVDVHRDAMVEFVANEGQRVITAYRDLDHNYWREGELLHTTSQGYLRTDNNALEEDNLGDLPEFTTARSNR